MLVISEGNSSTSLRVWYKGLKNPGPPLTTGSSLTGWVGFVGVSYSGVFLSRLAGLSGWTGTAYMPLSSCFCSDVFFSYRKSNIV